LYGSLNYQTGGGAFGEWKPYPKPMRDYGLRASIDDFADSFAAYVLNVNGITTFQISSERQAILSKYFALPY